MYTGLYVRSTCAWNARFGPFRYIQRALIPLSPTRTCWLPVSFRIANASTSVKKDESSPTDNASGPDERSKTPLRKSSEAISGYATAAKHQKRRPWTIGELRRLRELYCQGEDDVTKLGYLMGRSPKEVVRCLHVLHPLQVIPQDLPNDMTVKDAVFETYPPTEWTDDEKRILVESKRKGLDWADIAAKFPNRTYTSIKYQFQHLGLGSGVARKRFTEDEVRIIVEAIRRGLKQRDIAEQ